MAWRRPGDKPLSEPMMARLPTHICVSRPQWVNVFLLWKRTPRPLMWKPYLTWIHRLICFKDPAWINWVFMEQTHFFLRYINVFIFCLGRSHWMIRNSQSSTKLVLRLFFKIWKFLQIIKCNPDFKGIYNTSTKTSISAEPSRELCRDDIFKDAFIDFYIKALVPN